MNLIVFAGLFEVQYALHSKLMVIQANRKKDLN